MCVCLLIIITLVSASHGYTWKETTHTNYKSKQFSSEYDKLLGTFPEQQNAEFQRGIEISEPEDKKISRQGAEANYYARQIVKSKSMPLNLLHELRQDNPNEYQVLLQKVSRADYATLKACAEYPNAIAFY